MAEPTQGSPPQQTFLSATPLESTSDYQNLFRRELPLRRSTNFFGAVPPGKSQWLTTYLGVSRGKPPLRALLIAMSRPDLEMSVPSFGKPGASTAGRAIALGKAANNLRSLLDKPMDLAMPMTLTFPGGEINTVYSSSLTLDFAIQGTEDDIPMLASIRLRNPNPLNSGIFAFNIYFLPPSAS